MTLPDYFANSLVKMFSVGVNIAKIFICQNYLVQTAILPILFFTNFFMFANDQFIFNKTFVTETPGVVQLHVAKLQDPY
jgi:hypothetical protein